MPRTDRLLLVNDDPDRAIESQHGDERMRDRGTRRSESRRCEAASDRFGETHLIHGREARLHHQPRRRRRLRDEMDVRVNTVWPARAPLFCMTLYWSSLSRGRVS